MVLQFLFRPKIELSSLPYQRFSQDNPNFMEKLRSVSDLSEHGQLTRLEYNPHILKALLVMKGAKIVMMSNA